MENANLINQMESSVHKDALFEMLNLIEQMVVELDSVELPRQSYSSGTTTAGGAASVSSASHDALSPLGSSRYSESLHALSTSGQVVNALRQLLLKVMRKQGALVERLLQKNMMLASAEAEVAEMRIQRGEPSEVSAFRRKHPRETAPLLGGEPLEKPFNSGSEAHSERVASSTGTAPAADQLQLQASQLAQSSNQYASPHISTRATSKASSPVPAAACPPTASESLEKRLVEMSQLRQQMQLALENRTLLQKERSSPLGLANKQQDSTSGSMAAVSGKVAASQGGSRNVEKLSEGPGTPGSAGRPWQPPVQMHHQWTSTEGLIQQQPEVSGNVNPAQMQHQWTSKSWSCLTTTGQVSDEQQAYGSATPVQVLQPQGITEGLAIRQQASGSATPLQIQPQQVKEPRQWISTGGTEGLPNPQQTATDVQASVGSSPTQKTQDICSLSPSSPSKASNAELYDPVPAQPIQRSRMITPSFSFGPDSASAVATHAPYGLGTGSNMVTLNGMEQQMSREKEMLQEMQRHCEMQNELIRQQRRASQLREEVLRTHGTSACNSPGVQVKFWPTTESRASSKE